MAGWGPLDLTGKNAVITGGARGLGFGIARWFLDAGARVLIADVNEEGAEAAALKLGRAADSVASMGADVSKDGSGEAIVSRCVEQFGSVDIFVNNAGVMPHAPMLQTTPELFDLGYQVDLKGLAFCAKAAAVQMIAQGHGGKIINMASGAGLHPGHGLVVYNVVKAGVVMFTKSLALELGAHGINVNAVAPGAVVHEHTFRPREGGWRTGEQIKELMDELERKIPLGRTGNTDDVAKVAVFLASSASDYMTGEVVVVDGGHGLVW